ncbi:hypothetical protein Anapl_12623 [Anas platyrhynchos]|uniref:Uncharacterized protein n=1 Tax=Anas platyrhynchos TaxID=8839 RepID=R0L950_ANAPL|nr:hypothetical protein Anapl_12623 [Anas platyrhynchos]
MTTLANGRWGEQEEALPMEEKSSLASVFQMDDGVKARPNSRRYIPYCLQEKFHSIQDQVSHQCRSKDSVIWPLHKGRNSSSPSAAETWILTQAAADELSIPLHRASGISPALHQTAGRVQYGLLSDLKHGKACKPLTRLDNASKLKGSMAQGEHSQNSIVVAGVEPLRLKASPALESHGNKIKCGLAPYISELRLTVALRPLLCLQEQEEPASIFNEQSATPSGKLQQPQRMRNTPKRVTQSAAWSLKH